MLIAAKGLHKFYGDGKRRLHVLKGITLSIKEGELGVIVGPSGAGKSSLLHLLGGLDTPSQGKVIFDGIDLYGVSDYERSLIRNRAIGFVFQFYHLLPEFSALENVMMPAIIARYFKRADDKKSSNASIREKAKELLISIGLKDRIEHRPAELSGGEAQRVAMARALINEPCIVLCDEPTGNLDSVSSEIILGLIKDLNKNRKQAFLIVTHNTEVAKITDRIMSIKDGVIEPVSKRP